MKNKKTLFILVLKIVLLWWNSIRKQFQRVHEIDLGQIVHDIENDQKNNIRNNGNIIEDRLGFSIV